MELIASLRLNSDSPIREPDPKPLVHSDFSLNTKKVARYIPCVVCFGLCFGVLCPCMHRASDLYKCTEERWVSPRYYRALRQRCAREDFLWAGALIRMSGGRLPTRIVFRNLEGAVRRGRGGKEKEWIDCLQTNIRTFGIAGDWKTPAI